MPISKKTEWDPEKNEFIQWIGPEATQYRDTFEIGESDEAQYQDLTPDQIGDLPVSGSYIPTPGPRVFYTATPGPKATVAGLARGFHCHGEVTLASGFTTVPADRVPGPGNVVEMSLAVTVYVMVREQGLQLDSNSLENLGFTATSTPVAFPEESIIASQSGLIRATVSNGDVHIDPFVYSIDQSKSKRKVKENDRTIVVTLFRQVGPFVPDGSGVGLAPGYTFGGNIVNHVNFTHFYNH